MLSNYEPDYTEDDLQALIQEPRFLAAAKAYADDLVPLGLARDFGVGAPRSLGKIPSSAALTRLFHETARRIAIGQIHVAADLWSQYHDAFNSYKTNWNKRPNSATFPLAAMFSDLRMSENYNKYLKRRRVQFDEADLTEMTKNEYFLACIDAFRRGLISGYDVRNKIYPDGNLPRDLSTTAYSLLQTEMGRRLWNGRVVLPSEIERRYPDAYQPDRRAMPRNDSQ